MLKYAVVPLLCALIFINWPFNQGNVTPNMNFDLLTRAVWALPEDDWNKNIDQSTWLESGSISYEFKHGVASGDPTKSSVIIWTRITPSEEVDDSTLVSVWFEVQDVNCSVVATGRTYTNAHVDFTVKLDIQGLSPNTNYNYWFYSNSLKSQIGHTRTLPDDDHLDPLRLAVYSCANYPGGYYHAYRMPVIKGRVDYVVHLGDYIYEYANGAYTNGTHLGRDHEPEHECETLEDYRIRYALYRSDRDLQDSHAHFPWILVWDDHEVTDNSWLRGSVHTKGYEFLKRRDGATQAFFEWLPIRPQKNINKIWRSFRFGGLFNLHMLDTRHYSRDITDYYSNQEFIKGVREYDDRTILGYDQEEWLERQLIKQDTVWDLISSQCVVRDINFTLPETGGLGFPFEEMNQDAWDGYVANRNRILQFISDNSLKNSVILSGDFHIAIVSELRLPHGQYRVTDGEGAIIVEFTTSAVSSPSTFPRDINEAECLEISKELVKENDLVWNEGFLRGYLELRIDQDEIHADYYGVDVQDPVSNEVHMAHFVIKKDLGHLDRQSIEVKKGALHESLQK